jgi:hypothetical protein
LFFVDRSSKFWKLFFLEIQILIIVDRSFKSLDFKIWFLWIGVPNLKNLKEKKGLFSVGGFETETSNFALNGWPRVSKNQKIPLDPKKIQIDSQHTVNRLFSRKMCFLTSFLQNSDWISRFYDFFCQKTPYF